MSTAYADYLGFPQEAAPISTINQLDVVNRISEAVARAATLLRTLQYRLRNDDSDSLNLDDVERLVDMALQQLPDANGSAFMDLEEFDIDARSAARLARRGQHALSELLGYMDNVAYADLTFGEADHVVKGVYALKDKIPETAFKDYWSRFCDHLEKRGFKVEIERHGELPEFPSVSTPDSRKMVQECKDAALSAVAKMEKTANKIGTGKRR